MLKPGKEKKSTGLELPFGCAAGLARLVGGASALLPGS